MAASRTEPTVAVVGAGSIGVAFAIVFARAGMEVALWDKFPETVPAARDYIADRLPELRDAGHDAVVRARLAADSHRSPVVRAPARNVGTLGSPLRSPMMRW